MARLKVDGSCQCGRIRFEADIDPANVVICHCTDCQTFSGAPYRVSVPVVAHNFVVHGRRSRGSADGERPRKIRSAAPPQGT
jgi:hypothetical protein